MFEVDTVDWQVIDMTARGMTARDTPPMFEEDTVDWLVIDMTARDMTARDTSS